MTPATATTDGRWAALTARTLREVETCEPLYRPTNFWQPGVRRLLEQMETLGLEAFKTWPEAFFWFYPAYGRGISPATVSRAVTLARSQDSDAVATWVRRSLRGATDARRDYDMACMAWDQDRWGFDLGAHGESPVGRPTQAYAVAGTDARHGRPYLNYLLGLAALSRHVDAPPRSFLELGGGFGVLGEILLARDPEARYVDVDIPPLLTVASYYLATLYGDRVLTYDRVPEGDLPAVSGSACLPSWRLPELTGSFDVFWNSFSFQEMEPAAVANYTDQVARLGVRYVVSLNSRRGKPLGEAGEVGVREQVTSDLVASLFEDRGYRVLGRYQRPLVVSAGEVVVLGRG